MKKSLFLLALLALATPAHAAAPIEGTWKNPKGSVVIDVVPCGTATWCGRVAWASPKARADARAGGTATLVGTSLLTGLKATGPGSYRGRVLLPKRDMHATANVRLASANSLSVRGCVIAGMLCKEQRWTRVR